MKMPPALLAPPSRHRPGVVWGTVHSPGRSIQSGTTSQQMSVAPHRISTSPGSSAPATTWAASASTEPGPTRAPSSLAFVVEAERRRPIGSVPPTTSGSWSGRAPATPTSSGLQPLPSKSGKAQKAVAPSTTPRPVRAWLATAWAGQ
jgi:hypothetical protein